MCLNIFKRSTLLNTMIYYSIHFKRRLSINYLHMQGSDCPLKGHMVSTFCKRYPQYQSISLELYSLLTQSTDSIVNTAGILHHWFHLYRSRLVDSLDTFSVYYSLFTLSLFFSHKCWNGGHHAQYAC